jgi:uncharacterized protein YbjT (DUF2867 family)
MMYASVRRYLLGAGSIDALMHRVDEEFAPALSQQPGFVCYFALDVPDGMIAISVFQTRASAERSNKLAAAYVRKNLSEFMLTRTDVAGGEVLVSRTALRALEDAHRWRTARARVRSSSMADVSKRPVLVVGATGRTGRLIVDRLLQRGMSVHALVRDGARGRELLASGVRQFIGDVRSSHTLIAPMAGVGAVIIASSGGAEHQNSPELVDYFGTSNLIQQAVAGHVEFVLFVSALGATRAANYMDVEPTSVGWKARGEEIIRRSGVPYCIIRSGWLTDGPGGEPLSVSQGDMADGRISRSDLASLCTRMLFLPDARGKTIDVVAAQPGSAPSIERAIASSAPDAELEPHSSTSSKPSAAAPVLIARGVASTDR